MSTEVIANGQKNHTGFVNKLLKALIIKEKDEVGLINKNDAMLLINSINYAYREWANALKEFDYVDGGFIDYYIYKIKACQIRYEYLLKEAKKLNLSGNK